MEEEIIYPIIDNQTNIDPSEIIALLKLVFDPEISHSIYDLGLIYGITIKENSIYILMTLTSANCPEAQSIPLDVENIIRTKFPNFDITVEITFDPMWTVDNMSDEVKLSLGLF